MANQTYIDHLYDQIYATLYGQCIGDALGLLTETLTKGDAKRHYSQVGKHLDYIHKKMVADAHRVKWDVGDWTDESDQMILIMQSLIDNNGKVNMQDFARKLMEWWEGGFPDLKDVRGVGLCGSIKGVITHSLFSVEPQKAAEIVWRNSRCYPATNEAVSRTSVLGVHMFRCMGKVIQNTVEICKTTHADPRCQASCVAVTLAIALLLQKQPEIKRKNGQFDVDMIARECYAYASKCLIGTKHDPKELKQYIFTTSLRELKLDEPGRVSYTYKTLGAGFWALRQKDFREAIQAVVMEGGDADANGAVAGALLGCKLGLDAIPRAWIENLQHRYWLDQIIDQFLQVMEGTKVKYETAV
ncbi:ADP-ribosylarginine hydrolase Tri1-like isoform X2 [Liolophura sinensis]|uniref:ADP-ribosylarginine hydrolase Tri1-like isoform X2 n=1 Tax=Liolophura sinensis TaxID=3198878 RepID=UPI00315981CC